MRLILCSGGEGDKIKESYELFVKEVNNGKILYIPLAWENGSLDTCIDWFKNEMLPYGVTDIEDVLDAKDITKEKLSKYSGIFIGGGNTFKLLKMLKDTDAFESINNFLNKGGIIMGGSAGSLIFGKSIDPCLKTELNIKATDENLVGLKDTTGFDKIKGYSLFVHYHRKPEEIEKTNQHIQRLLEQGHKIICLPDETSLWINEDKIEVIGKKAAKIFDKKEERTVSSGEMVL